MRKAVVSFSGGMDSTTVLARAIAEYGSPNVLAVSFKYGSKHNFYENQSSKWLTDFYNVAYDLIDLSAAMSGFSSNLLKSGGDIPEGHYEDESMSQTVVPGRNIIFAAMLAGYAWSKNAEAVYMGIHSGDHAIYADCRPEFYMHMRKAIEAGTDGKVSLRAPFLSLDKSGILKEGFSLSVPYELTRTCYKEQAVSCGKCGSCQERLEAFAFHNTEDPLDYESREILPK